MIVRTTVTKNNFFLLECSQPITFFLLHNFLQLSLLYQIHELKHQQNKSFISKSKNLKK